MHEIATPRRVRVFGPAVLVITGLTAVVGALASTRYGYYGEELGFLGAGKYLDWGYPDQQPLVPLLARTLDGLFPGSLFAFRLPAVLAGAASVLVAALIAREFGGDRRAQTLTAGAHATALWFAAFGHYLVTYSLEPFAVTTLTWLLVRWVRTRDDRLLLWFGLLTALTLQVKFQVGMVVLAFGAAALACGPRELLRRPLLWAGAGIAVVTTIPTLIWQGAHGWPATDIGASVAEESTPLDFLTGIILLAGLPVGVVLGGYGLWRLLREHRHRFLGVGVLMLVALFAVIGGRGYYLAGCYALLFAAGSVGLQERRMAGGRLNWVAWAAYPLAAVVALSQLPVHPTGETEVRGGTPTEKGWPELASAAAQQYRNTPGGTAVFGETIWLAGALDKFGPGLGLPRAYSANRSYWYAGMPSEQVDSVLYLGDPGPMREFFANAEDRGFVHAPDGMSDGTPIHLLTGRLASWPEIWPRVRAM